MGCDIHAFRERRLADGSWECLEPIEIDTDGEEEWEDLESLSIGRDYTLFGLLAEVRREVPLAWPQRGLPDDVSAVVQADNVQWDIDAHSHSWLSLPELKEKRAELMLAGFEHVGIVRQCLDHFIRHLDFPKGTAPEDCRVVFWFDN